jgi:hypothetical protein
MKAAKSLIALYFIQARKLSAIGQLAVIESDESIDPNGSGGDRSFAKNPKKS